jgi:hypothetical protein
MTVEKYFILIILGALSICSTAHVFYKAWIKKAMHPVLRWYITIILCITYIGLVYVGYRATIE